MLDVETKNRINTARDILVGKVPDPKSQVEQITIALIYKFMDDMDLESEELGGKKTFFVDGYSKYSWRKIFDPRLSGYELLNLYGEAITKMDTNPGVPKLFRDIFKNAYLPYRDPETLKSFLKVINEFEYTHSEKLGDAFEYLLSVLGSQGDAGQFRTPRHIIDFMVAIIDPQKNETILDPACGTSGFLISSYRHIIKHNSSNFDPEKDGHALDSLGVNDRIINSNGYTGDLLSAADRRRLADNIYGYDISPDMVRLSLVNMYLHGIKEPHISEYDTLTSEDHWNHFSDVILANPPFMSPKGGIRPHKRFSVQSNRSEVLFVDYIAEHLTSNGRAAIIVPEGIIFQSGNAYKQLRKMLVEEFLVGVISLPAGIFQPYSGVKTSILWLDKALAKKTEKILFVKINNDGYDLGAQRRAIKENDLEPSLNIIKSHKNYLNGKAILIQESENIGLISKERILNDLEHNLNKSRYEEVLKVCCDYPIVNLSMMAMVTAGQSPEGKFYNESGNGLPFYQGKTEFGKIYIGAATKWTTHVTKEASKGDILMSVRAPVGPVNIATERICIGRGLASIRANDKADPLFLFYMLRYMESKIKGNGGAVFDSISKNQIEALKLPCPPKIVQVDIVAELESYQKIIDGARMVVENYKPRIEIDPEWEMVELGKVAEITSSKRIFQEEYISEGVPFYRTKEIVELSKGHPISLELFIPRTRFEGIKEKFGVPRKGDILLSAVGTIGVSWVVEDEREFYFKDGNLLWLRNFQNVLPEYIKVALDHCLLSNLDKMTFGAAYKALTIIKLKELKIPVPSIEIQEQIVATISKESIAVNSSKQLIQIFEHKIKDLLAKLWGEKS